MDGAGDKWEASLESWSREERKVTARVSGADDTSPGYGVSAGGAGQGADHQANIVHVVLQNPIRYSNDGSHIRNDSPTRIRYPIK